MRFLEEGNNYFEWEDGGEIIRVWNTNEEKKGKNKI